MGMAYRQGKPCLLCPSHQLFELLPDFSAIDPMIQKYIPVSVGQLVPGCHHCGNRAAMGAAVNEIQVSHLPDFLHQPIHGYRQTGQQTTHVVIDAPNIGHRRQTVMKGLDQGLAGHLRRQAAWPHVWDRFASCLE